MKTNFFQQIATLNVPGNWKLTIHTPDNINFTISALFTANGCGDNAVKCIPPMTLSGTADELGEGFFNTITEPVKVTAGLYHNMEVYLKGVEQARLNSKEEQDRKKAQAAKAIDAPKKPADGIETDEMKQANAAKTEAYTKAYTKALEEIAGMRAHMRYAEALAILPTVTDYPQKRVELDKLKKELENLVALKEKSLFA